MKKPELRPKIEDIIQMDVFQDKAKLLKIVLPTELNKAKIEQRRIASVAREAS